MKKCSKCELEKSDDKYYTYWHSTQKKFRTRRICTDCTSMQKKEYRIKIKESPELKYKNNPDYKKCEMCNTFKIKLTDFYLHNNGRTVFKICKECQRKKEADSRKKALEEKGGSNRIPLRPNIYSDIWQKKQTFQFMEALGWKFNEDSGIWWKDGIKKENGIFNFEGDLLIKKKVFMLSKISKDGRKYYSKITEEMYNKMVEMREKGMTYSIIAKECGLNYSTISKWIGQRRK